jgi:uncharacterized membrane protein YhiD involved in acid resistance
MGVRMILAAWRALRVFLAALWRVARQLFHEATGALFLAFALGGALSTWRQWRHAPAGAARIWAVGLAALFTAMMGAFSVASFRSARRVR